MEKIAIASSFLPPEAEETVSVYGYRLLRMPPNPLLPDPVADHPDLSLFFARDAVITSPGYAKIAARELAILLSRTGLPLCVTKQEVGDVYPRDVLFDAAPMGKKLFCLPRATASEIRGRYHVVPVRQGYAKCAVIPVTETALMTSDAGVASVAEREGMEVLFLCDAEPILLKGYANGFWGGAASFAPYGGAEEIFFCGDLGGSGEVNKITDFCSAHGKRAVSLGAFPLRDCGTIFLLGV